MKTEPILEPTPTETVVKGAKNRGVRPWMVTAGIGLLFVAVSVVMAFPSITRFRSATPGDFGDSYLYQYLLQWDVHALFAGGGSVFDASYFWPHHNTLLYSDTVLAVAPVAGALAAIVGWPVAFNLIYLGTWVASLAATYVLARWMQASRAGAVLAAFVFSFAAVRLGHYGHFQLLFAYFIPLTLWLLLRFLTERRWWQAVAVGLCCTALFFNSGYIAVALFPTLALVALGWLVASRFRPGRRFWPGLGLAGGVAVVTSWPVLSAYRVLGSFLKRSYAFDEVVTPRSFLAPASGNPFYGGLERWAGMGFEKRVFPGFVAMLLAVVGVVALVASRRRGALRPPERGWRGPSRIRRRRGRSRAPVPPDLRRRGLVLVVVSTIPALLLAFGKSQEIFGWRVTFPYSWVDTLPGFESIRAFGRFTVVPLLALSLLVAVGFDRLVQGRRPATAFAVAMVFGVVMLGEYKAGVIMTDRIDTPRFTAVNRALAALPEAPVVELPMGEGIVWGFVEAPRMVLSTIDWMPRVGGYSGYSPPHHDQVTRLLNSLDDGGPASGEALDLLDRLGVRYIVIRLAPVDGTWNRPGATYEDEGGAQAILRSLPPERVAGVSREGAALLVRLNAPGARP